MKDVVPLNVVRIVEASPTVQEKIAVIGYHIRAMPDLISDYCLARREGIFEDLATIVESIAYCDRRFVRKSAQGWGRKLTIDVPVYELSVLRSENVVNALRDAMEFLTGDAWEFHFSCRYGLTSDSQSRLVFPQAGVHHIVPFSDGLDSFAQARFSLDRYGSKGVLLVRSGLGLCNVAEDVRNLRVPRRFAGDRLREVTYRTRPVVFYTLAAIAAVA